MKNVLLFVCTVSICALGFSQMTSKNGHTILPEAGDWALQMDGTPVVNMALNAVNIMNNTGDMGQHPGYVNNFGSVIVGKYFNSDDFATRYKIALNSFSGTTKNFGDDPLTEASDDALISKTTESYWNLKLGYGHEYRRGHNRLQGFYGYEALIGLHSGSDGDRNSKTTYEFSYEDMAGEFGGGEYSNSTKQSLGVSLGARAFVGVEYFAAPKISVGAEFGWGLELIMNGRGSTTMTEVEWDSDDENHDVEEIESPVGEYDSSSFGFGVDEGGYSLMDDMSASLTISFHF